MPITPPASLNQPTPGTARIEQALAEADAALAREPAQLATLLINGCSSAAPTMPMPRFKRIRHHPDEWRGWLNYGHLPKIMGRTDDAVATYLPRDQIFAAIRRGLVGPGQPKNRSGWAGRKWRSWTA